MEDHPMYQLKQKLNNILEILPKRAKVAYLDYPLHSNVGDLFIMKGTERFFTENKVNVIYQCSHVDYSTNIKFSPDTTLVFHGGGNFGDIYPEFQRFRESFIKNYKKNRIIILPQTIYFKNKKNLEKSSELFSQHPDVHIFTRDKYSYRIAKKYFSPNSYLSPDMAHALWPICNLHHNGNANRLFILRTDREKVQNHIIRPEAGDLITDWPNILSLWDKTLVWTLIIGHVINKKTYKLPTWRLWNQLTKNLINKARELFDKYATIISNRLHGHLIACLMEKPNILLENSYGKNKAYFETWTSKMAHTAYKTSINDTHQAYESLG